jgi:CRP-like cAMP-binding protein
MDKPFLKHSLFQNLSAPQMADLEKMSKIIHVSQGGVLIKEGDFSHDFYVLLKGEMEVAKTAEDRQLYVIGKKLAGDLIGELGFIEAGDRSSTVKALSACELIQIQGDAIRTEPGHMELCNALMAGLSKLVSKDVRQTSELAVRSIKAELDTAKRLLAVGRFLMGCVFALTGYIFAFGLLAQLKEYLPSTTPISVGIMLVFLVVAYFLIGKSGFPLKEYGLSFEHWQRVIRDAILFSLPVMAAIVGIKWILLSFSASPQEALFQPSWGPAAGVTFSPTYLLIPLAYALFCPVQEFLARSVLQGSFHLFLTKKNWQLTWYAIILSNLMFGAIHVYKGFSFALLAVVPGLFWGWLFSRQKSLLGVSVSHIMIGVWAIFIVGFSQFM